VGRDTDKQNLLRELPAVQDLLHDAFLQDVQERVPRALVLKAIQDEIGATRRRILDGKGNGKPKDGALVKEIRERVRARLSRDESPGPVPVINATGVILHTNLGRAPLADEAVAHLVAVASGYSTLEYDLEKGGRGSRQAAVEPLVTELLGAEAALVVNNNAAAVMLVLAALVPAGGEVIVSRGELVEIGGSFRVPDILRAAGAKLVEVGTTNRTHLKDYKKAIGPGTAMLLKVHPSNFRVVGFTAEVPDADLAALAKEAKVPFVADLGSGMVVDLMDVGVTGEPVPRRVLKHADVVTFSGDKLLGGPQAGIIAGTKSLVEAARTHPLARAVRIDKLSLAALAATLRLALDPERAGAIPVVRMIRESPESVGERARAILSFMKPPAGVEIDVVESEAAFGGGSVPGQALRSRALRIRGVAADPLEERLRRGRPSVIARVQDGAVLLDARTIPDGDVETVAAALQAALSPAPPLK
jgi:L-seryl-tRNA(Ser) seleniumtransferase